MDYKEKVIALLNSQELSKEQKESLEAVFPELKESEDERIRKELIVFLKNSHYKPANMGDIVAWLEKQGEQKCTAEEVLIKAGLKPYKDGDQWCILLGNNIQEGICGFGNTIDDALYAFLNDLIKSQKEQKPADKVEPKFREGDWVVQGYNILKIKCIGGTHYCFETVGGYVDDMLVSEIDSQFHLWTIQDAKDGDVLATLNYILIFKEFLKNDGGISYCHYDFVARNPQFIWSEDKNWYFGKEAIVHPATKEQRDLLFQKMKEAGYQWDADKKELKKIEQKPAENEELTEFDKAVGVSIGTWNPKTPEQIQSVKAVSKKLLKLAKKQINDEQKPAELNENRSKELSLSLQIQAYLNTASDELYAKGKPLYSEEKLKDIHKCMLMWQKLHNAYFYQNPAAWSEEDEKNSITFILPADDHLCQCAVNIEKCVVEVNRSRQPKTICDDEQGRYYFRNHA